MTKKKIDREEREEKSNETARIVNSTAGNRVVKVVTITVILLLVVSMGATGISMLGA